jgi:DNA-binding NtrC family response regulator
MSFASKVDSRFAETSRAGSAAGVIERLAGAGERSRGEVSILVVDDEQTLRESCASVLRLEGYAVTLCARGVEAVDLLRRRSFDIVLIDLYLDDLPGTKVLETCLETRSGSRAIVMTGDPSVDSSLEVLRMGAWDYLPKPFSATHLQILIGRAARSVLEERAQSSEGEEQISAARHGDGPMLLGRSPAFCRAVELARRVARTDASVFIHGESGTGKEMIAQFIHAQSRRVGKPMVAVNCAALPETLLESEMFGHCKGAFTGAIKDKMGLLEMANGGTFFLDELTEMSQTIQAKFLRVIQDGNVRRVGSEVTDAVVNVRFIAATNRDPYEATQDGVLRKDLFYRLSVVPITLPPLRERPEDISLLAEHFLSLYWKRHREPRSPLPHLTPGALASLQAREWRGNVRELQNVIEHTVVLVEPGSPIHPDDIPFRDLQSAPREARSVAFRGIDEPYHMARERVVADFERVYLDGLVERVGSNMSQAAKVAGVDRTTLYRLMEKHGLQRDTVIKAG